MQQKMKKNWYYDEKTRSLKHQCYGAGEPRVVAFVDQMDSTKAYTCCKCDDELNFPLPWSEIGME